MVDVFFETPPKTKWEVLLPQVVLYSYKHFCMARLDEDVSANLIAEPLDLSGGIPIASEHLWSTQYELVSHFAPPLFKPFLEDWWAPEMLEAVPFLQELDSYLRELTIEFDDALLTDNYEKQNIIAELLEEDFHMYFDNWIPDEFRDYFFFPSPEEADISEEKCKHILELVKKVEKKIPVTKKTRRVHGKRSLTPLRNSLSKIRKTRRTKQKFNEVLQISTSSPNHGT